MGFARCWTCGRYLSAEQLIDGRYCSTECSQNYRACPTCGRYYPSGGGQPGGYCSQACAIQYKLNRFAASARADRLTKELA